MTVINETAQTGVYYDPYDARINADPYPTYARLREEAPIYYNERYDFWAHITAFRRRAGAGELAGLLQPSQRHPRAGQVEIRHARRRDDVSGPARTLDAARADVAGVHAAPDGRHRGPDPRSTASRCLDPLVGSDGFDIIAELGVDDADAGDRDAAGNPGVRTDFGARRQRRQPAHQARRAAEGRRTPTPSPTAGSTPTTSNGGPRIRPTT